LRSIESEGNEGSSAHADLLNVLTALRDGSPTDELPKPTLVTAQETAAAPADAPSPDKQVSAIIDGEQAAASNESADMGTPVDTAAQAPSAPGTPAAMAATPTPMSAEPAGSTSAPIERTPGPETSGTALSDSNVRVDVGLLDKLMNLVGELVLARNQILQIGARLDDATFAGASQRLNLITTELQEQVMRTRMQPIGNVWSRLPRVVRDLAVVCGKQVRVEMIGKDTELDRTVLEAIKDPLTHIVRNAVDHGFESPEVRLRSNKPRTGTLTLRAYHEGGQVNIEISDDGGGLNTEAIKQKALERRLVSSEQLSRMSEYELAQLVFLPGFSTAAKVTNVSGRGVGMDVVKTNVERIGGTVDLSSLRGAGTTLKIRIPLTLAIVPALVVVSGGQRFAIPQTNLLELVRLEGEEVRLGVESVHGAPVYRLRGQLLPLVYLSRALSGVEETQAAGNMLGCDTGASVNIIVLQADEGQIGLVVDEIRDTEEIVVKPLGKELSGIPVYAGATIMGDGRVALILDVAGLAQHVGAISRSRDQDHTGLAAAADDDIADGAQSQTQTLLLFTTGEDRLMAVPLSLVARIEEFPSQRLERAGGGLVVQYRREVLPLIALADFGGADDSRPASVIVYREEEHNIGFIVGRILDVVEESVSLERGANNGLSGTIVVQGKVTELLDVQTVIRTQAPWFYAGAAA
jgi:two-component system chemotaxis sensor kinase CheA